MYKIIHFVCVCVVLYESSDYLRMKSIRIHSNGCNSYYLKNNNIRISETNNHIPKINMCIANSIYGLLNGTTNFGQPMMKNSGKIVSLHAEDPKRKLLFFFV